MGSTDELLDDTGSVLAQYEYRAFGLVTKTMGPAIAPFPWNGDLGYRWDPDVNLYFLRSRYYDPAAIRFLSEDPAGFDGGDTNLYRYAANDPVNNNDPTGKWLVIQTKDYKKWKDAGASMIELIPLDFFRSVVVARRTTDTHDAIAQAVRNLGFDEHDVQATMNALYGGDLKRAIDPSGDLEKHPLGNGNIEVHLLDKPVPYKKYKLERPLIFNQEALAEAYKYFDDNGVFKWSSYTDPQGKKAATFRVGDIEHRWYAGNDNPEVVNILLESLNRTPQATADQADVNAIKKFVDKHQAALQERFNQFSTTERIIKAMKYGAEDLPTELKHRVLETLNDPVFKVFATGYVVSHVAGFGEAADAFFLLLLLVKLAQDVAPTFENAVGFVDLAVNAKNEDDLKKSGQLFAKLLVTILEDVAAANGIGKLRERVGDKFEFPKLLPRKGTPSPNAPKSGQFRDAAGRLRNADGTFADDPLVAAAKEEAAAAKEAAARVSGERPSWRQSEIDVGKQLEGQGFEGQKSFLNGKEVPYGTKGSSRPEYYKPGTSVEVKNYEVTSAEGRNNLVKNVTDQAKERLGNLPSGTAQKVVLDVRGQKVSREVLDTLVEDIVKQSNGTLKNENITILR
ncbi:RHS repeat domain-containing protein [Fimbriiglobus ruber]